MPSIYPIFPHLAAAVAFGAGVMLVSEANTTGTDIGYALGIFGMIASVVAIVTSVVMLLRWVARKPRVMGGGAAALHICGLGLVLATALAWSALHMS